MYLVKFPAKDNVAPDCRVLNPRLLARIARASSKVNLCNSDSSSSSSAGQHQRNCTSCLVRQRVRGPTHAHTHTHTHTHSHTPTPLSGFAAQRDFATPSSTHRASRRVEFTQERHEQRRFPRANSADNSNKFPRGGSQRYATQRRSVLPPATTE